jgi:hypothetical protein
LNIFNLLLKKKKRRMKKILNKGFDNPLFNMKQIQTNKNKEETI